MSDKFRDELDTQTADVAAPSPGLPSRVQRVATRGAVSSVGGRLMQRKVARRLAARQSDVDDNGVHAGAEEALSVAERSSGSPLPTDLRRRFEGSLGADLGGVRVHTDESSQAASAAVGARAYATGQDIHFAQGQFDPSSTEGQHLLAHEVAHTVQQSGSSARQPQFKLEVSEPFDHAELEADRAADAMMRGDAAAVSIGSSVSRSLHRDKASEFVGPMPQALPKPYNWAALPATPTSPVEPWTSVVVYEPQFAEDGSVSAYRTAFGESWAEAQHSYGQLWQVRETVMKNVTYLSNIKIGSTNGNATKAFEGDKLKDSVANVETAKVPADIRNQIVRKKADIETADGGILTKQNEITKNSNAITAANLDLDKATNNLTVVASDADMAKLGLDAAQVKRDLDDYKALAKATCEASKAAITEIEALENPTQWLKFGGQFVSALGAGGEADATLAASQKLKGIDGQVRGLMDHKFAAQMSNAQIDVRKALLAVSNANLDTQKVVADLAKAKRDRQLLFQDLGALVAKAGSASTKMSAADQTLLAGAVEVLPKLDTLIQMIEGYHGFPVPAYNDASGIGAAMAMAISRDEFASHLGIVKGGSKFLDETKTTWVARKASVEAIIAKAGANPDGPMDL